MVNKIMKYLFRKIFYDSDMIILISGIYREKEYRKKVLDESLKSNSNNDETERNKYYYNKAKELYERMLYLCDAVEKEDGGIVWIRSTNRLDKSR